MKNESFLNVFSDFIRPQQRSEPEEEQQSQQVKPEPLDPVRLTPAAGSKVSAGDGKDGGKPMERAVENVFNSLNFIKIE